MGDIDAYKNLIYGNQVFGLNPNMPLIQRSMAGFGDNNLVGTRPQSTNPFSVVDVPDLSFLDANQDKLNNKLKFQNSKVGGILSSALGAASGILGGPIGWAGLAISAIGDNIRAAKSQFDLNDFQGTLNDAQADYLKAAGSAENTSDLLNLSGLKADFTKDINNQGYQWDGSILGGIGAIIGNARTEKDKARARQMQADLNDQYSYGIQNALDRVNANTYRKGMANFLNNAAMGGPLFTHGSDFTDDLIRVDAGGTHEQNPLGGVPAGIDPQGIPNLVEEGETIWDRDNYVFSDRLKAPKKLVNEFKLGGGKKGLTYSEAARRISEKSGAELRPLDPISKRTKDSQLEELEASQEEKRLAIQQKKVLKALKEMTPEEFVGVADMMNQEPQMEAPMPPQGVNEEQMMQEPVQGTGEYEPIGFALGGHILSGTGDTSIKVTKVNDPELIAEGIRKGTIKYDKSLGKYVGTLPGVIGASIKQYSPDYLRSLGITGLIGDKASKTTSAMNTLRALHGEPPKEKLSTIELFRKANEAKASKATSTDTKVNSNQQNTSFSIDDTNKFRSVSSDGSRQYSPWNYGDSALQSAFNNFLAHDNYYDISSPGIYFSRGQEPTYYGEQFNDTPVVSTKGRASGISSKGVRSAPKAPIIPDLGPIDIPDALEGVVLNDTLTAKDLEDKPISVAKLSTDTTGRKSLDMLPTWMRYAPVIGGGLSVLGNVFSNPDYSEYQGLIRDARRLGNPVAIPVETIGNRLRRNPFDERLAVNQANQNFLAGIRGTMDTSGGNRAYRQFANNLLAYNNQGALSDIASKAYLANRQDALQTADFNRGTDMYNANAINQRNLAQAQLNSNRQQAGFNGLLGATQALDNARRWDSQFVDADLTGFLQSLGNIGKEYASMNMIRSLANEGVLDFAMGRNGEVFFSPKQTISAKCGGKIKTKKRRF